MFPLTKAWAICVRTFFGKSPSTKHWLPADRRGRHPILGPPILGCNSLLFWGVYPTGARPDSENPTMMRNQDQGAAKPLMLDRSGCRRRPPAPRASGETTAHSKRLENTESPSTIPLLPGHRIAVGRDQKRNPHWGCLDRALLRTRTGAQSTENTTRPRVVCSDFDEPVLNSESSSSSAIFRWVRVDQAQGIALNQSSQAAKQPSSQGQSTTDRYVTTASTLHAPTTLGTSVSPAAVHREPARDMQPQMPARLRYVCSLRWGFTGGPHVTSALPLAAARGSAITCSRPRAERCAWQESVDPHELEQTTAWRARWGLSAEPPSITENHRGMHAGATVRTFEHPCSTSRCFTWNYSKLPEAGEPGYTSHSDCVVCRSPP